MMSGIVQVGMELLDTLRNHKPQGPGHFGISKFSYSPIVTKHSLTLSLYCYAGTLSLRPPGGPFRVLKASDKRLESGSLENAFFVYCVSEKSENCF